MLRNIDITPHVLLDNILAIVDVFKSTCMFFYFFIIFINDFILYSQILATISKAMNFRPDLHESRNSQTEFWGQKQSNGEFSGMFGELVENKADIALGDLHSIPYILDIMDLTVPYNSECLTFLTPESLTDNSWKTLILPFK